MKRFYFFLTIFFVLSPFLLAVAAVRRIAISRTGNRYRRILVVPILTRVGDLVCSTPVFREIKRAYPNSHLAVVAGGKAIDIIKHNPRIDELIDFNAPFFHGYSGRFRFYFLLFSRRFDAVITLSNAPIGTMIALAAVAPIRVKTVVEQKSFVESLTDWMNNVTFLYRDGSFLQLHYLKLLSAIGIDTREVVKEVYLAPGSEEKVADFLRSNNIPAETRLVGITLTAGNPIKEWPLLRFAELASLLIKRYRVRVLFIDSPRNADTVDKVIQCIEEKESAISATVFTLEELPALISELDLFIAVDTGAIYIAHALGVPLVDIIGPVDPREQPPSDQKSIQVRPPPDIIPTSFVLKLAPKGADHRRAVEAIRVADVLKACDTLLESNGRKK